MVWIVAIVLVLLGLTLNYALQYGTFQVSNTLPSSERMILVTHCVLFTVFTAQIIPYSVVMAGALSLATPSC